MRRWFIALTVWSLSAAATGCGSDAPLGVEAGERDLRRSENPNLPWQVLDCYRGCEIREAECEADCLMEPETGDIDRDCRTRCGAEEVVCRFSC
jgi:hypothetical protein